MVSYKKSELTKELIMNTASALFLEKGYTATTVREICQASGISVSRVNYHFSSKADLAGEICRTLFLNFYAEIKKAIGSERGYSMVAEAVSLRFLVDILIGEHDNPASKFYRDVAAEGILADVFTAGDQALFSRLVEADYLPSTLQHEKKLGIYAHIFAYSLPAVIRCWEQVLEQCSNNRDEAKIMQDTFAGLFMQMLDLPHDAQKAMVDMSDAYYRLIRVELTGLTDVKVSMPFMLSLKDKVRIVESTASNRVRLKSSSDRSSIELDTDYTPNPPGENSSS